MEKHYSIALDGPSGSGKSTIAKAVAKELGYTYIDTGAMFRCIGLYCLEHDIPLFDEKKVVEALDHIQVDLLYEQGVQHVLLNGKDVSGLIREEEVGKATSAISGISQVREKLLDLQRGMADRYDVIMDGRDIGTVVLPNADLKIFMTASADVRARRRVEQLKAMGEDPDYMQIKKDLEERDYRDSHREVAPLKQADDAVLLDTSDLTVEEVKDRIISLMEERRN